MIISLATLRKIAEHRLPGYLDAAITLGRPLGNDTYEFTPEQVVELMRYRKPVGLGDAVKAAIHATLDVLPLPQKTVTRLKGCSKCAERAARLNRMLPDINLLDQGK